MLLACADISGNPGQVFRALTTDEVEKWWATPGVYHLKDWKADLRAQGRWSVIVELEDGRHFNERGEFC
ncbi:MAG: SRPBCC domain-containing protein, partial [Acidobacteriota bacterium]|nr:SRPBCC domain-containing protein [Acidobacteriota bacterium]